MTVTEHNGRCHDTAADTLYGQTLWRWRRDDDPDDGRGTVLDDVESPCPRCLAELVAERTSREWRTSGDLYVRHRVCLQVRERS